YAYGWYWGDVAGQPVVHHPGTELGYQNIFLLAPEENLAVITMGNALAADENFFYAMAIGQEVLKALLGAQPTETAATELPVPRFEPSDCKYPVLADTDAECGYLVVREDRSNPDSPTIRVHVIKYPSNSATPAPDPIIGVPGGPGASGDFYAWLFGFSPAAEAWRAERDVFALETRGAMYSEPAFYCPETEADWSEFVGMSMAEEVAWTAEAYRACHDRLLAGGVNFSAYGFLDIAGDIADLRSALGFEKVNVYGVSYGTTPAMLVMRDSPEWLRSVTLDSIIPPDIAYLEHTLENTTVAINNAIAACAADAICNAAYPNLESVFAAVLTQLRQEPAVVIINDEEGVEHIVTVDDVKFVHFLYDSIFIGDGFTTVPAGIYAAYQGDLQAPAKIWLSYIAGQHGPATAQAGAWAKGMTYAAMCLQDGSVTDLATATAIYDAVDTLPSLRDWGVTHMLGEWLAPCEYWAVTPADPNIATAPVASDVPTLLLGGIFDPEAPPAISVAAAEGFSHSFFYELPAGHGLLLMDCAIDLMTQFLADPTVAPDASCIDAMTPNWVLPE
ncbi:MAG: alpha/beta fold hydrolase, partial [Caldilineaceae bacterium]|nr:alpha/beta fold hydrolase [Caldilineaceae bacterium]